MLELSNPLSNYVSAERDLEPNQNRKPVTHAALVSTRFNIFNVFNTFNIFKIFNVFNIFNVLSIFNIFNVFNIVNSLYLIN